MKKDIRIRKMETQILQIFSMKAIEANDERIKTVIFTRIALKKDFKNVKVYFKLLKNENVKETVKALDNAKGFFKMALKENSSLRYIPEIFFDYDNF